MPHKPLAYSTVLDAFGANLSPGQYDLLAAGSPVPLIQLLQYGSIVPPIGPATGSITVGLMLDRARRSQLAAVGQLGGSGRRLRGVSRPGGAVGDLRRRCRHL